MVEKKYYSPEFRRMVAKAYHTSNKSLVKVGEEFKVNASSLYGWEQRIAELEAQLKHEQMRSVVLGR